MVGERLRTERERQNLSLRDIEKGTSIRAHYLEAIENGDFKALPGEVYAKGFVRNYATFLQMDANAAVKEFQEDLHGAANAPEKGKNAKAKDEPKKTNLKKEEPAKEPPKPQEVPSQAKPEESKEAKPETPASIPASPTPAPAQTQKEKKDEHVAPFEAYQEDQVESSHKKRNAVVALVLLVVVICGAFFVLNNDASSEHGQPAKPVQPVQQTQPPQQQQQQPQAQPAPAPAPAPQPPKPEGVELQLSFTDPCWTQVIVDGKNEFEGTVEGGKQLSFKGKNEIKLTGGNAGGVTITVNGQNQGPLGEAGQVVEKSFKAEKPAADTQQGQAQPQPQPQQNDAAANANANAN